MVQPAKRSDRDGLVSERARQRMIELLRERGVRSEPVLAAMVAVPRHAFVDPGLASRAYEDMALPIGQGQTISKPSTVARMIELLVHGHEVADLRRMRVLEIGTGCGYQAAVLSRVFADVVTIERVRWLHELARSHIRPFRFPNLRLVFGDGSAGVLAGAPYDAIISAAAAGQIADAWLAQLAIGGRLVAPVHDREGDGQALHRIERVAEQEWQETVLDPVRFVPLRSGTVRGVAGSGSPEQERTCRKGTRARRQEPACMRPDTRCNPCLGRARHGDGRQPGCRCWRQRSRPSCSPAARRRDPRRWR